MLKTIATCGLVFALALNVKAGEIKESDNGGVFEEITVQYKVDKVINTLLKNHPIMKESPKFETKVEGDTVRMSTKSLDVDISTGTDAGIIPAKCRRLIVLKKDFCSIGLAMTEDSEFLDGLIYLVTVKKSTVRFGDATKVRYYMYGNSTYRNQLGVNLLMRKKLREHAEDLKKQLKEAK